MQLREALLVVTLMVDFSLGRAVTWKLGFSYSKLPKILGKMEILPLISIVEKGEIFPWISISREIFPSISSPFWTRAWEKGDIRRVRLEFYRNFWAHIRGYKVTQVHCQCCFLGKLLRKSFQASVQSTLLCLEICRTWRCNPSDCKSEQWYLRGILSVYNTVIIIYI